LRGVAIEGRVVTPEGRGVAAEIIATGAEGGGNEGEADADGRFRLPGLAPGKYDVVASAPGWAYAEAQVEVAADRETTRIDLALGAGGALAGRVTALDGR